MHHRIWDGPRADAELGQTRKGGELRCAVLLPRDLCEDTAVPLVPFGPYTLVSRLGRGGMGELWLALNGIDADATGCAIKMVREDIKDTPVAQRFLDESRVVLRLHHKNVAAAIEAGVVDHRAFLAFELVRGGSFAEIVNQRAAHGERVPVDVAVHAMAGVLDALAYAHAAKDPASRRPLHIIHRDVSPHNIMIDLNGIVKLIDFGVAQHQLKQQRTAVGRMVGKLRYSAPEYVRGDDYDHRADLFAATVAFYELLCSERFYEDRSDDSVMGLASGPGYLPAGLERLAPALRAVIVRGIATSPGDRYPDAGSMKAALLAAHRFADDPVSATQRIVREGFGARVTQLDQEIARARAEAAGIPEPSTVSMVLLASHSRSSDAAVVNRRAASSSSSAEHDAGTERMSMVRDASSADTEVDAMRARPLSTRGSDGAVVVGYVPLADPPAIDAPRRDDRDATAAPAPEHDASNDVTAMLPPLATSQAQLPARANVHGREPRARNNARLHPTKPLSSSGWGPKVAVAAAVAVGAALLLVLIAAALWPSAAQLRVPPHQIAP